MFCREVILLLESFASNYNENLGIKISTNYKNCNLKTYYFHQRFNKTQFLTEIDSYLETLVVVNHDLIVCGDFNIDQLYLNPKTKKKLYI